MDSEFDFWYPVIIENQPDFEGHIHQKEVLKTGHISHGGRLLCGESREVLKNRVKKDYEAQSIKDKTVKLRVAHTKICPECLTKYMKNGHSAYHAWVEGKPLKVTSIEKAVYSAEGK